MSGDWCVQPKQLGGKGQAMPDTKRQTSEDSSRCPVRRKQTNQTAARHVLSLRLQVRLPAASNPPSRVRESPTLTGEELLDPRKAKATEEDADYDPGDTHSDDQGHNVKGSWRQNSRVLLSSGPGLGSSPLHFAGAWPEVPPSHPASRDWWLLGTQGLGTRGTQQRSRARGGMMGWWWRGGAVDRQTAGEIGRAHV